MKWTDQLLKLALSEKEKGLSYVEIATKIQETNGKPCTPCAVRAILGRQKKKENKEESPTKDLALEEYIKLSEKKATFERRSIGIVRKPIVTLIEKGWFAIVFSSDWHIGSTWTHHEIILREVEIIHDTPHMYLMFGGDTMEGGIPVAPHGGILNQQIMPPREQRKVSAYMASRIGSKMKLACSGCHDWWLIDAADYDFIKEAFSNSGCQYMGNGGKYYLECFGGAKYVGVYFHKANGHSQYNIFHPCVRRALFHEQEADIICIAHNHLGGTSRQVLGEKMRYMARTGARKEFDRFASKLAADETRSLAYIDVPVLLLHGSDSSKVGQWVMGIKAATYQLKGLREWDEAIEKEKSE